MNTRIRNLRRALGLTRQEFADKLGISRNSVGSYETGLTPPTDAVVAIICKEFCVNEDWLRTGKGPMSYGLFREGRIQAFVDNTLPHESEEFRNRLAGALARMKEGDWVKLAAAVENILENQK